MTQLSFIDVGIVTEKELFSLEKWERLGRQLCKELKESGDTKNEHEADEGRHLWAIGDWLLYGERLGKMGDRKLKYRALAQFRGYAWNTLKAYKVVSKAIPEHRRRYHLSYSIHREIASLEEPMQEQMLDWVETRQKEIDQANIDQQRFRSPKPKGPVSVRDVRQEMKKQIGKLGVENAKKGKKGIQYYGQWIKIPISVKDDKFLGEIQRDFETGKYVGNEMLTDNAALLLNVFVWYLNKYKDQIKAIREEYRITQWEPYEAAERAHRAKKEHWKEPWPKRPAKMRLPDTEEFFAGLKKRQLTPWLQAELAKPEKARDQHFKLHLEWYEQEFGKFEEPGVPETVEAK